ncbi:hypothetical protein A3C34_03970 [Candidatus Amesbacteria bacterium RIFCSPHIGHO2_02_FULL_48_21]|uniref:Uncharacterized protein n=4 Tax=Candidatus Amesiibacteriota TaxID=1752730 RepID=A0A1F4Z996_9BACT|nr:MAG: hypothetical protein UX78_C0002G0102 [Candidatus Amesbacteria bacterium GW2011_GWA2_47_11]KKU94871.1 MAG: hypothetical protein UY22_C0005G0028 [Candidatus Amesbacteria bacterium GW2011_GWC1_48_10]KKW01059.1 MAG: hypothetical protein UY33_C0002G0049 [Candidatus Amesbacteria bacterium GW2011_GWA1_48_9]OGC89637.1 MAG: hypothetical protein A2V48_02895 [Candidatus Amesbacteria bacterium RBG_19FT_COMBO_48_16]OGC96963.1 MAG: hypothetical protein A3C34_03970 [Candidatus Amesbacteria bacterium R
MSQDEGQETPEAEITEIGAPPHTIRTPTGKSVGSAETDTDERIPIQVTEVPGGKMPGQVEAEKATAEGKEIRKQRAEEQAELKKRRKRAKASPLKPLSPEAEKDLIGRLSS